MRTPSPAICLVLLAACGGDPFLVAAAGEDLSDVADGLDVAAEAAPDGGALDAPALPDGRRARDALAVEASGEASTMDAPSGADAADPCLVDPSGARCAASLAALCCRGAPSGAPCCLARDDGGAGAYAGALICSAAAPWDCGGQACTVGCSEGAACAYGATTAADGAIAPTDFGAVVLCP
jgi:hypothetical protein